MREFGWDGMRCGLPEGFEAAVLGPAYARLDDGAGRAVELRRVAGAEGFEPEAYFRRLAREVEKSSGVRIEATVLPAAWEAALAGRPGTAFWWRGGLTAGRGIMLHCPVCRSVGLIQFLGAGKELMEDAAGLVLSTFRDHAEDGRRLWAVYDLRAELPDALELVRHDFRPGRFELVLAAGRLTASFLRFAPAEVILRDRDLAGFAAETFAEDVRRRGLTAGLEGGRAVLSLPREPGVAARLMGRLTDKARPYCRIETWRPEGGSRILAVRAESAAPLDEAVFRPLAEGYGLVS